MTELSTQVNISVFSAFVFFMVNIMRTKQNNVYCTKKMQTLFLTLIFGILSFISMYRSDLDTKIKIKHSIYGALMFYFLSSSEFYVLINEIMGTSFASKNGCITLYGIILSSFVYCLFLIFMMQL
jgi:hypothetical protein